MRLLVSGSQGQVGWELSRALLPLGEVICSNRAHLDLSKPKSLRPVLDDCRPDVIINAAAYTAVDEAEDNEELATTVNGHAVGELAEWARRNGALLVHYSTDYVFDGSKAGPYLESDATNPINAYGRSKLVGEQALADVGPNYLCLRTSWVYANRGNNFFLTMLRLAKEREQLQVVADQSGVPNWAPCLADASAHIVSKAYQRIGDGRFLSGIYHLSGLGSCSWHGFASQIFEQTRILGHEMKLGRLDAISSSQYPTRAKRPRNSRLASDAMRNDWKVHLPEWQAMLAQAVANL